MKRRFLRRHHAHVFGDCDRCGHSAMYHAPFVGCLKCACDEFK